MRAVLANLGFVMQFAGLFTILPIAIAFYYNEINALISLFITSLSFLSLGFVMNALCERKELNFKSSCILITSAFFLLALIGSIPYFYLNIFQNIDIIQRFTNGYFESATGFTTTGMSLIKNIDTIEHSVVFYRALTQFIGGIGIVFILLAFFYPSKSLFQLGRIIGFEDTTDLKKFFFRIFIIYLVYFAVFSAVMYYFGSDNLINIFSIVFSGISTGGFAPTDISKFIIFPINFAIILLMVFGAISFSSHYNLLTGKLRKFFTAEIIFFVGIIVLASLVLYNFYGFELYSAFFHVVSASTTTGFSYANLSEMGENAKEIFVFLMFLGGTSLSTAGGIKIIRLILIFKTIPWIVRRAISDRDETLAIAGRELKDRDVVMHMLFIILGIFLVAGSAFILSLSGFSFVDSLFESVSAFATTGLSVGIADLSLALHLKWLLALLMIFGRIEFIPFLVAILPERKQ